MRLRRPCEHDRYEPHIWFLVDDPTNGPCPGGEFLPEGARIFSAEMVASWRFCPRCGRPNLDQPKVDDVPHCLPTNCDIWVHESMFNHETRQWDVLRRKDPAVKLLEQQAIR